MNGDITGTVNAEELDEGEGVVRNLCRHYNLRVAWIGDYNKLLEPSADVTLGH